MRAVTVTAAMLLLAAAATATVVRAPAPTSPWKITENWKVQLSAGGMQIAPAYTSINSMYIATTEDGTVSAVNTTTRSVQWTAQYDDIAFVAALPVNDNVFIARYSKTTVLSSVDGSLVWESANVTMTADLSEQHNALVFGSNIVYRDSSLGYVRLCGCNGLTGERTWCDTRRVWGTPDAAQNNTFTAVFYDVNGTSYSANLDAITGQENWFAFAPVVYTGSEKYVGLRDGPFLTIVNAMTGLRVSRMDVSNVAAITSSLFIGNQFFFTDGSFWVAAMDCMTGKLTWNVTAPNENPDRRVEIQRDTPGILVLAVLSDIHTNFTRLSMVYGTTAWTVTARPTGMSLAPIHAWLGTDILYVRNIDQTWSAWGADSGLEIANGKGDLFLPRSVTQSFTRPNFGFYVTSNAGEVINLRIESRA